LNASSKRYYKWVVVAAIWVIACLNYTDRMTIFSMLPALRSEMGLSDIGLALLGSSFLWVYAVFSPVGGYLGDRFPRRQVILLSLVLFSLVTFATGIARTGKELIALRCLLGVSEAMLLPSALAYIATLPGIDVERLDSRTVRIHRHGQGLSPPSVK